MGYFYLSISIITEVIATTALKYTSLKPGIWPWVLVFLGYSCAFFFLSLVLRTVPVGVAYGIWSAVGMAILSLVGLYLFDQKLDWPAVLGLALIGAGVLTIQVFSKTKEI